MDLFHVMSVGRLFCSFFLLLKVFFTLYLINFLFNTLLLLMLWVAWTVDSRRLADLNECWLLYRWYSMRYNCDICCAVVMMIYSFVVHVYWHVKQYGDVSSGTDCTLILELIMIGIDKTKWIFNCVVVNYCNGIMSLPTCVAGIFVCWLRLVFPNESYTL